MNEDFDFTSAQDSILHNPVSKGGSSSAIYSFGKGVTLAFGGASLVFEIGEDIAISVGAEDKAALIGKASTVIAGPNEYISILSLNPQKLADPGNVLYVIDKAGQLINFARDAKQVYVDLQKSKQRVAIMKKKIKELDEAKKLKDDEVKTAGLPEGKYRIDNKVLEVKEPTQKPQQSLDETLIKNINDIANIANVMAMLKAENTLSIRPSTTKGLTGESNTLSITIPDKFKPPFTIKDMSQGESGATLGLPSTINSNTFTAEFISSNPGIFSPSIQIVDADGEVVSGSTTIAVEGEMSEEDKGNLPNGKRSFKLVGSFYTITGEGINMFGVKETDRGEVLGGELEMDFPAWKEGDKEVKFNFRANGTVKTYKRDRDGPWQGTGELDLTGSGEGSYDIKNNVISFCTGSKNGTRGYRCYSGKFEGHDKASGYYDDVWHAAVQIIFWSAGGH